jgi:tetratricopeptide (TPR) repeat protein
MANFRKRKNFNRENAKTKGRNSLFCSSYCIASLLIFTLTIMKPGVTSAWPLPEQELHDTLLRGIDLTLKQDYPKARALFQSVTKNYPDNPAGYLYLAGTMQAEYSDYENTFDQRLFDSLLAKGEALAERLIEKKDSADWGCYYAGTALSYRAFSESENGSWPSVIIDGMNAAKMFERCLELNPQFYDAMNGLGTYYYWRSKKTEFLSWLPFVSNKEDEGIELLSSAVEKGTYEKFIAMNSLALVFIEEKEYDEALTIVQNGLQLYPDNRSFLWCLMGIVERMPQRDTAAIKSAVFRMLASVMKAPVRNQYCEAACRLKLAQFAMEEHRYNAVIDECGAILKYESLEGKTKRDIGKKIKAAKTLMEQAEEAVNSEKLKVKSGD